LWHYYCVLLVLLNSPTHPTFETLSLHDALPISPSSGSSSSTASSRGAAIESSSASTCSRSSARVGVAPGVGTTATTTRCPSRSRSEEHTSELQSRENLVCRLLLEKQKYHA